MCTAGGGRGMASGRRPAPRRLRIRSGPAPALWFPAHRPAPSGTDEPSTSWGDWRSGSALRSHRRGHWFEPSIAHPSVHAVEAAVREAGRRRAPGGATPRGRTGPGPSNHRHGRAVRDRAGTSRPSIRSPVDSHDPPGATRVRDQGRPRRTPPSARSETVTTGTKAWELFSRDARGDRGPRRRRRCATWPTSSADGDEVEARRHRQRRRPRHPAALHRPRAGAGRPGALPRGEARHRPADRERLLLRLRRRGPVRPRGPREDRDPDAQDRQGGPAVLPPGRSPTTTPAPSSPTSPTSSS